MTFFLWALLLLLLSALFSLVTGRHSLWATWVGAVGCVTGCALALVAVVPVLQKGLDLSFSRPWSEPVGSFALHLDPLAAFFILPIALVSACGAVYAVSYMHAEGAHRPLAPHWFFYNFMVLGMLLVVSAANGVIFIVAWEIMTIASYFLVAWDHHLPAVRQAAWLYLLAAHCGLMLLLALFILAGVQCGSYNFADFGPLAQLSPTMASLLFLLALFGFGVKAGLLPVHIWLPDAHPAAPSHVSAVMSAVLVKTGVYAILRIFILLPAAPVWWGVLVSLLGAAGALYGISMAIQQRDIKRCLAYSTIENLGIIFLGLGLGMLANSSGHPNLALFAYAGGLLHIWNHALFKGLMFMGAGTLLHATGTRDMNFMGGLLKRMPLAGLLWIGGSLAIGALPPLNGLVSEWLIYLSLIQAGNQLAGVSALFPLLLIGLLALVGALALIAFVRLIGICLLGTPRSTAAANAHEASFVMLAPMALLLAGCLGIGLYPQGAVRLFSSTLYRLAQTSVQPGVAEAVVPLGLGAGVLVLSLVIVALVLWGLRRRRPGATEPTWGCGFQFPTPRMAYTGEGFAEMAAWHLLPNFMRPQLKTDEIRGVLPQSSHLSQNSTDPILIRVLQPIFILLADRCQRLRWLQQGQLSIYLLYIFIASTLLMAWSLWAGGQGG